MIIVSLESLPPSLSIQLTAEEADQFRRRALALPTADYFWDLAEGRVETIAFWTRAADGTAISLATLQSRL